jgi:hypothetical protein
MPYSIDIHRQQSSRGCQMPSVQWQEAVEKPLKNVKDALATFCQKADQWHLCTGFQMSSQTFATGLSKAYNLLSLISG